MHATSFGESVSEVTVRTRYSMLSHVFLQTSSLVVRIVLLLPLGEVLAGDTFMLSLPGYQTLGAVHGSTVWTN